MFSAATTFEVKMSEDAGTKPARSSTLTMKVSEKGGLSLYGLGRFPVTLYKEQWARLLDHAEEIRSFLKDNDQQLKAKQ